MDLTLIFAQIVGPVLLLRALSIVIDREHFDKMLAGLEGEITTVSFSLFPIALRWSWPRRKCWERRAS